MSLENTEGTTLDMADALNDNKALPIEPVEKKKTDHDESLDCTFTTTRPKPETHL